MKAGSLYSELNHIHSNPSTPFLLTVQRDIQQLKRVQKFALRMCSKQWDLGYEELLNRFNIPSLDDHRKYLNLCTMYKIVHDHVYFPHGVFVPRVHSHVPHTCTLWNNLPSNITHACTLSAFMFSLTIF